MKKYLFGACLIGLTAACTPSQTQPEQVSASIAGINLTPETSQADNTLSNQEKEEGWQLLWDGKTSQAMARCKTDRLPCKRMDY